ncbi:MAG TPA: formate--tetrahydrofolate ligase [Thermoplasmata archaeon]|nr:formate--tetrahydrofolate ligase [Thermoplasmata archaeon]
MRTVAELGERLGLGPQEIHAAGSSSGKVAVAAVRERARGARTGRLVLVTAITPTRHGEGKTVTTIGLADALVRAGGSAVACLRQPSMGPVFGVKGGATGGGKSTVEPSAGINLGFTGDIHAVASAHNLLSALLDNHLYHGNALSIDPDRSGWPRTLDVEDRALRHIRTWSGPRERVPPRSSRFLITAASEVMAILALSRDYPDLKERLGRILVGVTRSGEAVRASDLAAAGAMAALLKEALEPNVAQSAEGNPVLVHAGPFANIAHGTASRLAIELALSCADFAVVEAGFATELGAEKFMDLVAPAVGKPVDAAVLVVTIASLRYHGGAGDEASGSPDLEALERGLPNLEQHLAILATYGVPVVVAINDYPSDLPAERERVRAFCREHGVEAVAHRLYSEGGAGGVELANAVRTAASSGRASRPFLDPHADPVRQVEAIVRTLYGGAGVLWTEEANAELTALRELGEVDGPVCMAKTPLSLSDDPKKLGRPKDFTVQVRHVDRSAGAGFTVVRLGSVETMPGLPAHPASERIDLAPDGTIVGLS